MAATKPVRVSPETHSELQHVAISVGYAVGRHIPMAELIAALVDVGKLHMADLEIVAAGKGSGACA